MQYWTDYVGHQVVLDGKRNKYDSTIYTFDIETTSYIVLNGKQLSTIDYLNLSKKEQDLCEKKSIMYIWQLGINDKVYYGRTWQELDAFLDRIEKFGTPRKKYIFVHNLAFEFQYLRNYFEFSNVFARKSRKVIKCTLAKYNFEFRCTYYMSNCSLEKLADIYQLDIKKLKGNLDYNKIRHSKTELTAKELKYCEYDCLIVYKYILKELEEYEFLRALPLTSTGHVRKELKTKIDKNWKYLNKTRKAINQDGHIYSLLLEAFAGGYTHANWTKANEIIKDVSSFDFTSSYPFVMVSEKYPMSEFKRVDFITDISQIWDDLCYIIVVRFKNIRCKYLNTFISESKCRNIKKGKYDNGRIIGADEIEIVLTDIDLTFIFESYTFTSYEFLEVYYSKKDYLPKEYIEFILDKYVKKTEYKNVEGKEIEYMLEKNKFNALYGMTVTNNIKDNVIYDNDIGWYEEKLTDEKIQELLLKDKDKGYLSFSWGCFVTAYARYNLLSNLIKLDDYCIYR